MPPSVADLHNDPRAHRRGLVLTGAVGGIQMCDPVIAALALPRAGADLDMSTEQLALAASISTLFLAATVVLSGALADRIGRHRMLMLMLALAVLGDLVVVAAPGTGVFLVGRALAGVGLGGALACSYAYVRVISPDDRLGHALGFWAAMSGIASVPLCLVGAGLANLDWRLAFLVTPVAAALCAALVTRWLPSTPPDPQRRELVGVVLSGCGVVGILAGISRASAQELTAGDLAPAVVGVVLVVLAGIVGSRALHPAYPVWVFRDPGMLAAALSGALWNLALAVAVLQSSNLWQYVDAVAPFTVSALQLPANFAVAGGSYLAGRMLAQRVDLRLLLVAGFVIAAAGCLVMARTGATAGLWFTVALTTVGFGAGAAGTVQSQVLLDAAPPGYLSAVAASRTTFGQIGYAVGLAGSAVVTTVLTIGVLADQTGTTRTQARQQLDQWLTDGGQSDTVAAAFRDAFSMGMAGWAVVLVVGGLASAVLLSRRRPPQPTAAAEVSSIAR